MTNNHHTSTFLLSDAIEALRISEDRMRDSSFMPAEQMVDMLRATIAIVMALTSQHDEANFTDDEIDLVHRVTTTASNLTNEIFMGDGQ